MTTTDIKKAKALASQLLDDLDTLSNHPALKAIADEMTNATDLEMGNAVSAAYLQVSSLPSRIDSLFKLASTMQMLRTMEVGRDGRA